VVYIIQSVEQFRKELKVGSVFWHMTSRYTAPHTIDGPCTIIRLWGNQYWQNTLKFKWFSDGEERTEEKSLIDLTSCHHGVFLSEEDAYEYFERRKNAYAQDLGLIAQVAHQKEVGDRMRKRWEERIRQRRLSHIVG
jgi:hypothetical protein